MKTTETTKTKNMTLFSIIVAFDEKERGIGLNGKLVWKINEDMQFFRKITTYVPPEVNATKKNAIIMGRRTLESIHMCPLPKRINICISSTLRKEFLFLLRNPVPHVPVVKDKIHYFDTLDDALMFLATPEMKSKTYKTFVIGGEQLYKTAICHPFCNEIYANIVSDYTNKHDYDCMENHKHVNEENAEMCNFDAFFPEIDENVYECVETQEINCVNAKIVSHFYLRKK